MLTKEMEIRSSERVELIDITEELIQFIRSTGVQEGLLTAFVPHTTASVIVNEGADPSVVKDIKYGLEKLFPHNDPAYRHQEGNSAAHLKASLLGPSIFLPVEEGYLKLGTWQAVFFAEFDGPRQRKLLLSLLV